ncbi:hypothetical protein TRFO_31621 [Tritrichomonas foetus]|uniref:Uncharacterized protein n=1 Tax=Tritrichomonas foetus TaxID=1144522 RepID=A0A1J4JVH6_9EUKA|nr:hypothetical protein TRFO_31621 [Tritrichomonas foetus]|eukprot:OHT01526.1 hypothetical protein TRFO_31621 [Tritrichomonas foetus]
MSNLKSKNLFQKELFERIYKILSRGSSHMTNSCNCRNIRIAGGEKISEDETLPPPFLQQVRKNRGSLYRIEESSIKIRFPQYINVSAAQKNCFTLTCNACNTIIDIFISSSAKGAKINIREVKEKSDFGLCKSSGLQTFFPFQLRRFVVFTQNDYQNNFHQNNNIRKKPKIPPADQTDPNSSGNSYCTPNFTENILNGNNLNGNNSSGNNVSSPILSNFLNSYSNYSGNVDETFIGTMDDDTFGSFVTNDNDDDIEYQSLFGESNICFVGSFQDFTNEAHSHFTILAEKNV